jgi:hypothetical protein
MTGLACGIKSIFFVGLKKKQENRSTPPHHFFFCLLDNELLSDDIRLDGRRRRLRNNPGEPLPFLTLLFYFAAVSFRSVWVVGSGHRASSTHSNRGFK